MLNVENIAADWSPPPPGAAAHALGWDPAPSCPPPLFPKTGGWIRQCSGAVVDGAALHTAHSQGVRLLTVLPSIPPTGRACVC